MRDLFSFFFHFGRSCRDRGPVSLSRSRSLSALERHGRDELLHLVGQPLLPCLFVLLQGCRDLRRETQGRAETQHGRTTSCVELDLTTSNRK